MADIDFYQDDSEDAPDDGGDNGLGCDDYDGGNPDDNLTPIQRLEKYMDSENIFNRQMVARSLLDTIRLVDVNREDANTVLIAMARLSEDPEPTVRAELMEQVPHLAVYCHENKELFDDPITSYVLPTVVKYLTDSHNQVRKTSQAALLVLLEQDLVHKRDVEQQVCPVILDLSSPDSIDDFRTEAVALMSKMSPLVGKDITERLFLARFCELCTDALFHVRKVCAANFGDMCSVVGQDKTEEHLLPKFYYLCEDGVWGVRKACAECFMAVSCSCSLDVRRNELASLFISLICDQSRWVRMAAFQALGGFISTFADPAVTGLYFNEDGTLVVGNAEEIRIKLGLTPESECLVELANSVSLGDCVPSIAGNVQSGDSTPVENSDSSKTSGTSQEPDTIDSLEIFEMDLEETIGNENIGKDQFQYGATSTSCDEHLELSNHEKSYEEKRAEKYSELSEMDVVSTSDSASDVLKESIGENVVSIVHKELAFGDTPAGEGAQCDICNNNNKSNDKLNYVPAEQVEELESRNLNQTESSENDTVLPSHSSVGEQEFHEMPKFHGEQSNSVEEFNSFQFWRSPLPEVDVDVDLEKVKPDSSSLISKIHSERGGVSVSDVPVVEKSMPSSVQETIDKIQEELEGTNLSVQEEVTAPVIQFHTANVNTVSDVEKPTEETVANIGSTHVIGQQLNETTMAIVNGVVKDVSGSASSLSYSPEDTPSSSHEHLNLADLSQNVIPQPLLDHYLSMTDPSRAQTVDTEIAKHCAYSLPAVAYTLGRQHWPCLKELYETLAADMQWKVRRTLAFSLHELAIIVGEEITNKDLVPVFNGFLKDLDEVRIGVLKHLADFLRLLKPDIRRDYLYKMQDFLNTDNNRNWRFREELAEQLTLLIELYTAEDIGKHLVPVALALAEDKVSEVRITAFRVLAGMLRRLSMAQDGNLVDTFVDDILERFVLSKKWNKRQIYAQLCQHILDEVALPSEQFAKELLPSLLSLGTDPIPNVRISLAKTLAHYVLTSEYFTSANNPQHEDLLKTVQGLQSDADRDVRYFITRQPPSETDPGDMVREN